MVAVAESVLVFKTFAHTAFPATGYLDPGIAHVGFFLISQLDLQFYGFARQLIEGVRGKRTTFGDIALGIGVFAVKNFGDVTLGANRAK